MEYRVACVMHQNRHQQQEPHQQQPEQPRPPFLLRHHRQAEQGRPLQAPQVQPKQPPAG